MKHTYAIGDVHGCVKTLDAALRWVDSDASPGDTVVMLGDYVDRGPDSKGVVELLIRWDAERPGRFVHVVGNHDVFMRDLVTPKRVGTMADDLYQNWMLVGGEPTVASYGARRGDLVDFLSRVPSTHAAFLWKCVKVHSDDLRVYVHGGIVPWAAPEDTPEEMLTWVRNSDFAAPDGKLVVCGHTPVTSPKVTANTVNVDTGCVFGGALTVVKFSDADREPIEFRQFQEEM